MTMHILVTNDDGIDTPQLIALARVAPDTGDACEVEIRGKRLAVRRVKPPFVRNGQAQIEL